MKMKNLKRVNLRGLNLNDAVKFICFICCLMIFGMAGSYVIISVSAIECDAGSAIVVSVLDKDGAKVSGAFANASFNGVVIDTGTTNNYGEIALTIPGDKFPDDILPIDINITSSGNGYCGSAIKTIKCGTPPDIMATTLNLNRKCVSDSATNETCVVPHYNLYINADTVLCPGVYKIDGSGTYGVIIINSSNVVLDCNGATLNGTGPGRGIYTTGNNNVTIKNCNVMNYFDGICLNSDHSVLINNTVVSTIYGIDISHSDYNTLTNNILTSNNFGLSLSTSSNNTIFGNDFSSNNYNGMCILHYSDFNMIINNTVNNNLHGIYLYEQSNFNQILDNEISNNDVGITTSNCSWTGVNCGGGNKDNTIRGNKISNNTIGIYSQNSSSTINSNYVCGNTYSDFHPSSSDWQSSSGDNNTCTNANGWNDTISAGRGCRYSCNVTASCVTPYNNMHINGDTILCHGTYNITTNCWPDPKDAIIINSSNVILDCNGSTLIRTINCSGGTYNPGYGVYNPGFDNITIKNCNLMNFYEGIHIEYSVNNAIMNITASSNTRGIYIYYSSNNNLTDNNLTNNRYGVLIYGKCNNSIDLTNLVGANSKPLLYYHDMQNITIRDIESYGGIFLCKVDNSYIENVTIDRGDGIVLYESDNNTLTYNYVTGACQGYLLSLSNTNRIIDNTAISNNNGIAISQSFSNILKNNIVNSNAEGGIRIMYLSSNNVISSNIANLNNQGIYLTNSNNNIITSNSVCENTIFDIALFNSYGNSGDNNTCDNPDGWNDTSAASGCRYRCNETLRLHIAGYILNCMGNDTFPNATVELLYLNGSVCDTVNSDEEGYFEFVNVLGGNYTIRVSKFGYISYWNVSIIIDNSTSGIGLFLCAAGPIYGFISNCDETERMTDAKVELLYVVNDSVAYTTYSNSTNYYYGLPDNWSGLGFINTTEGFYQFVGIEEEDYYMRVSKSGYITYNSLLSPWGLDILNYSYDYAFEWNISLCKDNRSDLVVNNLTYVPQNPAPGDNVIIKTSIENSGNLTAENLDHVNISLFIDNIYKNSKILNLTNKYQEEVNFTWTASSGVHEITIKVDPDNEIPESDETNNNLSIIITLQCPRDYDNDGFCNEQDNCPYISNDQSDTDNDGLGDACDYCTDINKDMFCDDETAQLNSSCSFGYIINNLWIAEIDGNIYGMKLSDIDGDGIDEIILITNKGYYNYYNYYNKDYTISIIKNDNNNFIKIWNTTIDGYPSLTLADIDNDNEKEIIVRSNDYLYNNYDDQKLMLFVFKNFTKIWEIDIKIYAPDLVFTGINFSNENPSNGEQITVTLGIFNNGSTDAADVRVDITIHNNLNSFHKTDYVNVPEYTEIAAQFNWTAVFGDNKVYGSIDPGNLIIEKNESNNRIFTNITVVDLNPPQINILSPANNSVINGHLIEFNIMDDVFVDTVSYSVNGGDYQRFYNPFYIFTNDWASGEYTLNVYANDTSGNSANKTYNFIVDAAAPEVYFFMPEHIYINETDNLIEISADISDETGIEEAYAEIYFDNDVAQIPLAYRFDYGKWKNNFTANPGYYLVKIIALDLLGNVNDSEYREFDVSKIVNSTVDDSLIIASIVTDSRVKDSEIQESIIENSAVNNSQLNLSGLINCEIINSTIIRTVFGNATFVNASVVYGTLTKGVVIIGNETYHAPYNLYTLPSAPMPSILAPRAPRPRVPPPPPPIGAGIAGKIGATIGFKIGALQEPIISDLDNDGKKEIITVMNQVYIFENDGYNNFIKVWNSKTIIGFVNKILIADTDNDGRMELVVSAQNKIYIFENTGNDTYTKVWNYSTKNLINDLFIEDLNNDGKIEMIVSTQNKIYIFENTGDNSYSEAWNYSANIYGIRINDLNNDGKREIIFYKGYYNFENYYYGYSIKIHIFENDESNNYNEIWNTSLPDYWVNDILFEDLNNDDLMEIITVGDEIYIYENFGNNFYAKTYDSRHSGLEIDYIGDVMFGDINGDGKRELIVHSVSSPSKIYIFEIDLCEGIFISKSTDRDTYYWNEEFNYTIILKSNVFDDTKNNITVTDNIPGGLKFLSSSSSCKVQNKTVTWNLNNESSNSLFTINLNVKVEDNAGGNLINTVTAETEDGKGNNYNSSGNAKIYVSQPGIDIKKSPGWQWHRPTDNNASSSFTITVNVHGKLSNVMVTDTLPDGARFINANPLPDQKGNNLTWNLGDMENEIRNINLTIDFPGVFLSHKTNIVYAKGEYANGIPGDRDHAHIRISDYIDPVWVFVSPENITKIPGSLIKFTITTIVEANTSTQYVETYNTLPGGLKLITAAGSPEIQKVNNKTILKWHEDGPFPSGVNTTFNYEVAVKIDENAKFGSVLAQELDAYSNVTTYFEEDHTESVIYICREECDEYEFCNLDGYCEKIKTGGLGDENIGGATGSHGGGSSSTPIDPPQCLDDSFCSENESCVNFSCTGKKIENKIQNNITDTDLNETLNKTKNIEEIETGNEFEIDKSNTETGDKPEENPGASNEINKKYTNEREPESIPVAYIILGMFALAVIIGLIRKCGR